MPVFVLNVWLCVSSKFTHLTLLKQILSCLHNTAKICLPVFRNMAVSSAHYPPRNEHSLLRILSAKYLTKEIHYRQINAYLIILCKLEDDDNHF